MPDLILSDISLPEFDCWTARRLCNEGAPEVPFCLYSGTVGIEDRRLACIRGVFGAAEKDLPNQLISVVRRALGIQS
jgi:DNA-binding NtrC family response regulator